MQVNQIGLEAEYFLLKDNKLVFPKNYGLECDSFAILGEIRSKPGNTRAETIANFYKEYHEVLYKAERQGLTVDISTGLKQISPIERAEYLRASGNKEIPNCKNIYDIDIMNYSDACVEDGKILHYTLSIGTHIHFSSKNVDSKEIIQDTSEYQQVQLPLAINEIKANIELYKKTSIKETKHKVSVEANVITNPVIKHIVKTLDEKVFYKFKPEIPLKYRNPGFYEIKPDGRFEYRSLPFNKNVLEEIPAIVDLSFTLLENLFV